MDSTIGADLEAIFADPFLTVAVSIGNASTRGMLDQQDELIPDGIGGQAQARSTVVTIKQGSLGSALVTDAAATVNGTNYKVREIARSEDGLLEHFKVA